jgi:hypothetical protein
VGDEKKKHPPFSHYKKEEKSHDAIDLSHFVSHFEADTLRLPDRIDDVRPCF